MREGKYNKFSNFVRQIYAIIMKSAYQNAIINKIRRARLNKNYSQSHIATLLGISSGQIGNIETPKRTHKYTLAQLSSICDELDINIENLFLDDTNDFSQEELIKRLINSIIEYEK